MSKLTLEKYLEVYQEYELWGLNMSIETDDEDGSVTEIIIQESEINFYVFGLMKTKLEFHCEGLEAFVNLRGGTKKVINRATFTPINIMEDEE